MDTEVFPLPKSALDRSIRDVLHNAAKGKGQSPQYLTAYQVFERLPNAMKQELISKYGSAGGKESDTFYSACNYVAQLLSLMEDVSRLYIDTAGLQFWVDGKFRTAGYEICAIYSLR